MTKEKVLKVSPSVKPDNFPTTQNPLSFIQGIIWLRLHAFLALTLAALAVGLLTPVSLLERHYLEEKGKTAEEARELAEKAEKEKMRKALMGIVDETGKDGYKRNPWGQWVDYNDKKKNYIW